MKIETGHDRSSFPCAGLVLAAGLSRRMGYDKRRIEIGGRTLLHRSIDAAREGGLDPVLVVSGPDRPPLPPTVIPLINPTPGDGLSSSLILGVTALPASVAGVMVLLADMPAIGHAHVARLLAAFAPGRICVPVFAGKRGNPVLLARCFFPEILALTGDVGARRVLTAHPDRISEVEMPDSAPLLDLDTPADLDRFIANASTNPTD